MNTILFPTDFSNNAINASNYAGLLAKKMNAKIILLHVYSNPVIADVEFAYNIESLYLNSKKEAEKELSNFRKLFERNSGIAFHQLSEMVTTGMVADAIVEVANSNSVSYIVMGTKGATNILDRWFGTISQNVMKSAACPVWIIPENTAVKLPKTIMYAADFKENEISATEKILDIALSIDAICNVIHIHENFELNVMGEVEKQVSDLKNEFVDENISFKNIKASSIISALDKYIELHKPDAIAMAMHEKSFLSKLFDTSISNHFVQEGSLPLLTFKK